MTTQPVPDDDQPGLQARFRHFLDRLIPIIFGFAVVLAIAFAAYTYRRVDSPTVAIVRYSLFLLAVVVLLLLLLWQFNRRLCTTLAGLRAANTARHNSEARHAIEYKMLEAQKHESLVVLAGGIAHDFNNLLAIILGNADLARMELPPDSPTQELLAPIIGAVQRATALTQQMLAYSGKGHFLIESLDLNSLLHEMQEPIQIALGGHVTTVYQIAPDLPLIEADASQIRQAVLNLAINAAEAIGPQRGTITIRTGLRVVDRGYLAEAYLVPEPTEGRYVYIDIADTGSGMDAATRARIFEPFFTTKFMGRGLGLAAVLGIVRGHRGAVRVQSAPEQGTTFTLLLPALTAEQRGVETRQPEVGAALISLAASSPTPGGAVLIVDDEDAVLVMAARILERAGFTVLTAGDGHSAITLFSTSAAAVACVLLDLMMPGTSGDRIFREIRHIKPDARIILMSGYDEREATSRLADQRPTSFLQKPFSPEQLRDAVRRALG